MVKVGDYTIENTYQGGYNTLDPNKAYSNNFTGYRTDFGKIGITTNPQIANQIKDVSEKEMSEANKSDSLKFISKEAKMHYYND